MELFDRFGRDMVFQCFEGFLDNCERTIREELVSKISGLPKDKKIMEKTICDLLLHRQGIFQGTPMGAKKIAFLNQADLDQKAQAGRSIIQYLIKRKTTEISRVVLGSTSLEPPVLECHDLHHPS